MSRWVGSPIGEVACLTGGVRLWPSGKAAFPPCLGTNGVGQRPTCAEERVPGAANACSGLQRFAAVC
eukprot:2251494-Alexandrium_andersonii.AAC.1